MISRYDIHDFSWIDLQSPDEFEIRKIEGEYNLEYFAAHDLKSPTPRPRIRAYESGKFLCAVMHIPAFKHTHQSEAPQEIDFVIGRNMLITARYEPIDALLKFEKKAEFEDILGKKDYRHIFIPMMQEIQNCLFDELAHIEGWIDSIEENIFAGRQKQMVLNISEAGKNLLNFRRTIKPHKEILDFLKTEGGEKFGKLFGNGVEELLSTWERLDEIAKNQLDMLLELRATNDSILSTGQNEVMKTLTILASMTIPASIIASIFNMSVTLPLVDNPNAFWIIIGCMVFFSSSMFIFFKYKKWI